MASYAETLLQSPNGMTNELKTYYSKALLARLIPALEHANHGLAEDIPPHMGRVIEKRRFESYTVASPGSLAPLTEGTPGTMTFGTWSAVYFTISQYGAFAFVSDVLTQQGFDGIDDMINAFGEQAGNTIDQVIRDTVHTGVTIVYYPSGVAARASISTPNVLTAAEVRKAVRKLRANNAKPFDDGYFHALVHPDVEYDLQADTTIQNVYFYAADRGEDNPLIQGAVPAVFGCKFFRTTNAKVYAGAGAGGLNVYGTLFLAKEAYLVSKFSTQNVRTIIRPVGSAGALDPLEQFGSIGWKASVVAGVLNGNCLVRVESYASQAGT